MFYGIEQSTDLRAPATVVKRFASRSAAMRWKAAKSGEFTHADPAAERNHHRTFRSVYELKASSGKRLPSKAECDRMAAKESTSMYPRSGMDVLAKFIVVWGDAVESS